MTDQQEPERPSLKRKPQWAVDRQKRKQVREQQIKQTPLRSEHKLGGEDDFQYKPFQSQVSTHIDPEIVRKLEVDFGISLQWVSYECLGQPDPNVSAFYRNKWQPLLSGELGGALDHLVTGPPGTPIRTGGLELCARPKAIQDIARKYESAAAADPLGQIRHGLVEGGLPIPGGDHPSALAKNQLNTTMERVPIPEK